jgi:hypothetical protein
VAFAVLMGVHGLIHALGFAKSLNPGFVPSLTLPISRPMGLLWLAAATLWGTAAVLTGLGVGRWWMAAAPALILSQVAIATAWQDARFGTLVNAVLLVPLVVVGLMHAPWSFQAEYARGTGELLHATPAVPPPITELDIAALPVPVQRYLRYAGAVGQPAVRNYQVRFTGGIRERASDRFMPSITQQFSQVEPAERWFLMRASRAGIPFEALHVYRGSEATFRVRVAGAFTVVSASGPEMDQSETVTLFNDLCLLAPAALVTAPVTWHVVTDRQVHARFTNAGHTIDAELTFDGDGALVNFASEDRYRSADGKVFRRERWTTPVTSYRWFGRRRVAATADARWTGAQGEFTYARFEVADITYNVSPVTSPASTS